MVRPNKHIEMMRRYRSGGVLLYALKRKLRLKRELKSCGTADRDVLIRKADDDIRGRIVAKLRKRYAEQIEEIKRRIDRENERAEHKRSNKIWIMWWQGMDNAPAVVKMCYQSVKDRYGENYEIILLDKDNYREYIELPEDITEKIENKEIFLEKGQMPLQFLTDIIRLELLIKYGGLWMDATILCTGKSGRLPSYIENSDLFFYEVMWPNSWITSTTFESWFIYAVSNSPYLMLLRDLVYVYTRTNKRISDYLMIYCLAELLREKYPDLLCDKPPAANVNALSMQRYLREKFDANIYDCIISNSDFHKLTWRVDGENFDKKGTLYEYLINNYPIYQGKDKNE